MNIFDKRLAGGGLNSLARQIRTATTITVLITEFNILLQVIIVGFGDDETPHMHKALTPNPVAKSWKSIQ